MKKNNQSLIKNIQVYIAVGTITVGLIASWVKFQAQAEQTKDKVEKLDKKVDEIANEGDKEIAEIKEENNKLDKELEVSKTQQENIKKEVEETNRKVEQINLKTDKIVELLLDIKAKKK